MKPLSWCRAALVFFGLCVLAGCGDSSPPAAASRDSQTLTDLKNLRDLTILSPADYEAKVAAMVASPNPAVVWDAAPKDEPSTALLNLKVRGLLTDKEYAEWGAKADAIETSLRHPEEAAEAVTAPNNGQAAREDEVVAAAVNPPSVDGASAAAAFQSDSSSQGGTQTARSVEATQSAQIADPVYQMHAATLLIPVGWKFAGGVVRPRGCHARGAIIQYSAQSADGLTAVELVPGIAWSWTSNPQMVRIMQSNGCPPIGVASAAEFLTQLALPQLRPSAQLVSMDDLPQPMKERLATEQQQMQQRSLAQARQFGFPLPIVVHEGKRARIRYEMGGQAVEEWISVTVDCTERRFAGNMVAPPSVRRDCTSGPALLFRAPAGQLEVFFQQATAAIRLTLDPAWSNRLAADQQAAFNQMQNASWAAHNAQMAAGAQAQQARTQAWQANEAARAGQVQSSIAAAQASQAALDRSAHETALSVLGRATFVNPSTGQRVEADSGYKYNYQTADGHTYGTDNPLDPNRNPLVNGTYTPIEQTH